jgi:hypothetical protein
VENHTSTLAFNVAPATKASGHLTSTGGLDSCSTETQHITEETREMQVVVDFISLVFTERYGVGTKKKNKALKSWFRPVSCFN